MPFTCEGCGRSAFPDLLAAVGNVLRCPNCESERSFRRPPLLVVTGPAGVGKSTLCARLAGTVPGAVFLDADIYAEDLVSVAPPRRDYAAFWRSMMRLAHELAQNDLVVVYFSVMLPEQVLANCDLLGYFASVHFACLACPPDALRARIAGRDGSAIARSRAEAWVDFNAALTEVAATMPTATVLDARLAVDQVERDVRRWMDTVLSGHRVRRDISTG